MCNETIQPPETNGTIIYWGPSLLGAEFVRGRVCQGPRCPGILQNSSYVKCVKTSGSPAATKMGVKLHLFLLQSRA